MHELFINSAAVHNSSESMSLSLLCSIDQLLVCSYCDVPSLMVTHFRVIAIKKKHQQRDEAPV